MFMLASIMVMSRWVLRSLPGIKKIGDGIISNCIPLYFLNKLGTFLGGGGGFKMKVYS